MECTQCQAANRDGARFCSGCGAALALLCSSCGTELAARAKFCDQCGTPTSSNLGAAAAPAHIGAVRKTVTVVFCDLGGSTSFGERTDAETAREVMARYHALLQDVVDTHGGTVAKFMGDGMMATFGIPEIAEDDAVRAVRAGVDVQRRFTEFATTVSAQHRETLTLRVGVNTGEVVIASGDADLIGDALNVAARLEKACRPGNVLVGEETWRLTRGEFGYESLGEVTVAGRAQAVAIYEVASGGAATVEKASPFVGRALEMHRLNAVFDIASSSRAARLVTVLGSPGVGKTRLSRELCTSVETNANALTFEVRCDRAGDATFAPIAQLIREATGLGDDADAELATTRVGALLADDEPERDRLTAILAGLVGAAPARSVEETFWAIRRLVTSVAATRPLVVVIDDIQWAEPLLLDLLEHLAEWVQDVPLVLLCLARPELREVRPSLAEQSRRVEDVLALDGLDSAATEQLAAGLLGTDHLPAGLVARLPTSTDGNPLFVRELVRMLVEDQVIRLRDGEWELAIDADAVEVPPTIQSLLATRVERLPNDERVVLELASVIGAEFSLGALRELAGDDTPLAALLETMRRKELVEPTGTYWGDEPVHRFHHVLIRDSAYRRLLKTTRADLHERVAVWTDQSASGLIGEHEAVIAYHYEQAYQYRGELGTIDEHASDLGRRAAELLSTAADRALGRDDLQAAGALARRALALLPEDDATARSELLLIACECLLSSGDVGASRPVVEELRAAAGSDPSLGAWAACFEAQLIGLTDPEGLVEAEATSTSAAAVMEELGDRAGEAKAHQVRAALLARLGRVGDAELELDLALGAARRVDDRRRVTAVLGAAPVAALWGPSPVARAGGRCLDVVRLLRITTASPSVEATSMRCQAVLEALRGRFDVSRSMLASARASLEELGLRHGLLETEYLAGVVELVAGDPAAAIEPLRASYHGFGEMGVGVDAGRAAALLARALLAQGNIEDAEPMAAASEALAGQDLKTAIAWRVARAEVLAARGDAGAGVALAEEAVAIAAGTDLIIDHADACVALADLREAADNAAGAQQARANARRLYDAKGATVPAERLAGPEPTAAPTVSARTPAPTRPSEAASAQVAADGRTDRAENLATRVTQRFLMLLSAGRVDEAMAITAPDHVQVDSRKTVSGEPLLGRDAFATSVRATLEVGLTIITAEPLAVRGDRLHLSRVTFRSPDGNEQVMLSVSECTVEGLDIYTAFFEEDDLAAALVELDERFFAGEGAALPPLHRGVGFRAFAAVNARDWDAYRDTYTADLVCTDRRQIGWPTLDRDGLVTTMREYTELAPDLTVVSRKFEIRGPASLVTIDATGTTPDGVAVQWVLYIVSIAGATGISKLEMFDEGDFEAALARLDELGTAEPTESRTPTAENLATTVLGRAWELTVAGRADEVGLLCAEDAVVIDGQRIVGEDLVGRDAIVANCRAVAALGADAARVEPLAVRGSRLGLVRTTVSFGSFENVFLSVGEVDAQGLGRRIVTFDEHDLAAAQDELDERHIAAEGAAHADLVRTAREFRHATATWNFDLLRAVLADQFVLEDHRELSWGTLDLERYIELQKGYADTLASGRFDMVMRTFHTVGRTVLITIDNRAVTTDGVSYEWVFHGVVVMPPAGRVGRIEMFDETDFDAALVCLDRLGELGADEPRSPVAENAATAWVNRLWDLYLAGQIDEIRPLLADDAVMIGHRSVIGTDLIGADAIVANLSAITEFECISVRVEPLAVRGSRLALARFTMDFGGFESVFLATGELNPDGLCTAIIVFDDDALVDAMAELDARYLAGPGPHGEETNAGIRALNTADWDALRDSLAPDFAHVDHRELGFPTVDREGYIEMFRGYRELAPKIVSVQRRTHVQGATRLHTVDVSAVTSEGNALEWSAHVVIVLDPAGRDSRQEWFPEDQFDAALARFDELSTDETPDARHPRAENLATSFGTRLWDLFIARRIDELRPLFADDAVMLDKRSIIGSDFTGADAIIANFHAAADFGSVGVRVEPLAVRGSRLGLARITLDQGSFESVFLSLGELDADGLCFFAATYDEDDLVDATDELDARYIAGEGAPHARELNAARSAWIAMRDNDTEKLGQVLAPNLVTVDHQRIGFGTGTRVSLLDQADTDQEIFTRGSEFARTGFVTGNAILVVYEAQRVDRHGGEFEWLSCAVVHVDESDRTDRIEWFDIEDWGLALARLDELGAAEPADPRHPRAENSASQWTRRLTELMNGGGLDEVADMYAVDVVAIDHRSVVSVPILHGRAEIRENLEALRAVGLDRVRSEVLAVRGDCLVLQHLVFSTDDGREMATLSFNEWENGQVVYRAVFDEDALTDAVAGLEERYLAGEGAPHARLLRAGIATTAAAAVRDFDALRERLSPEFVLVDRRPIGFGALDREQFLALINASEGMGLQVGRVNRVLHIVGNAILAVMDVRDVTDRDSEYARVSCVLSTIDPSGRIDRMEGFDITQFDAALARLDELGAADPRHPRAENAATRAFDRDIELAQARQFDELRAMYADEFVRLDRRSGVSAPTANGPDEFVAAYSTWFDVGFEELVREPIAVRGDRLALCRFEWRSNDGREVVFLGVSELDEHGRFLRDVHFDETAVVDAIRELDERYLVGEGAPHARVLEIAVAGELATPDTVGALLSPDFAYVDHRPIGFGTGDREYFVRASRTSEGLATNLSRINRTVHLSGNAVLGVQETRRVGEKGSDYAWLDCVVMAIDASDRIAHLEYFDLNDFDAALARLDELGAPAPAAAKPRVENQWSRGICAAFERLNRGEREAASGGIAPDVVRVDRRRGISAPTVLDEVGYAANAAAIYEVFGTVTPEVVAVRGKRLALIRLHCGDAVDGFELELLCVFEGDADGQLVYQADFDGDDLIDAIAELEERYLVGEGAPYAPLLRAGIAATAAAGTNDFDALAEVLAPDFVFVDHTPIGYGTGDRDYFVAASNANIELGIRNIRVNRVVHVSGNAALGVQDVQYVTEQDSEYARTSCVLLTINASGRIDRIEWFDVAQYDAALARLDELAATAPTHTPLVTNRVSEGICAAIEQLNRGEVERLDELGGIAPDIVRVDRRRGVSAPTVHDDASFAANAAAIYDVFGTVTPEVVAVRGERLALIRLHCGDAADGFELQLLCVYEINAAGDLAFEADFDGDDIFGAYTELEDRWCLGEGAKDEYMIRRLGDGVRAHALRDWKSVAALYAPDMIAVNHRSIGFPVSDAASMLEMQRSLLEVAPDVVWRFSLVEIADSVALVLLEQPGTTADGSWYEWSTWVVGRITGGLMTRVELFDADDAARARARFEELAAEPRTSEADNSAARAVVRLGWLAKFDLPAAIGLLADRVQGTNYGAGPAHAASADGRASWANVITALADVYEEATYEAQAVRGDRLALARYTMSAEGFEVSGLVVAEVDGDHRICLLDTFDESDRERALEELDRRYREIQGAAPPGSPAVLENQLTRSIQNLFDRAAEGIFGMDGLVTDDVVRFDTRRSVSTPTLHGRAEFEENLRAIYDVFDGGSLEPLAIRGERLALMRIVLSHDGFEASMLGLYEINEEGLIARGTTFDEDNLTGALDELEARYLATPAPSSSIEIPSNTAVRALSGYENAFAARDWDWFTDALHPDVLSEDRRTGIGFGTVQGREALIALTTGLADVGFETVEHTPLAVRGDHLFLARRTFRTPTGFDLELLGVLETDGEGRLIRHVQWDPEDLAAAVAELERGYLASGDAPPSYAMGVEFWRCYNARDWGGIREVLGPDARFIDHRPVSGGTFDDTAGFVEYMKGLVELAPDLYAFVTHHIAVGQRCVLASTFGSGTSPDGLYIEFPLLSLGLGAERRSEIFTPEQLDLALARFHELEAESG